MLYAVAVTPLENYRVHVRFNDGAEGIADLSDIPHIGVFEPWKDPSYFQQVQIDEELGTIVWPSSADIDPYVLYSRATGVSVDEALNRM